jgi:AraC-like DNA-binding protein
VGSREYEVKGGNFLLACRQPYVKAYFESKEIVKSICIDICSATVAEAFTIMSAKDDQDFDNYLAKYFRYPEFFESVCPVGSSQFKAKLDSLVSMIHYHETDQINKEWFLDLTEKIIYHSYGNYLALNGIQSVKLETRKELLRRVNIGKQFMDDNFLTIDDVTEVALASNLSEFHFFRSFKQAFGITTYQYILNKKLELARTMLHDKNSSITAIASVCNFPDLFTFSKAFKRRFGIAPSQFQKASI